MPAAAPDLAPLDRWRLFLEAKARSTQAAYRPIVAGLLGALPPGAPLSEEAIVRYVRAGAETSDDVYNQRRSVVASYCRVAGLRFPLELLPYRRVSPHDRVVAVFSPDQVHAFIAAAATHPLPLPRALAALATTYGLRRVELAAILPRDLDLPGRLLAVRTAKGGVHASHLLPEEILPALDPAAFAPPRTVETVHGWFKALARRAGIPRQWHEGFDMSIRTALVRGLLRAGLGENQVERFMRWNRGRMAWRYERGHERDQAPDVDGPALLLHPFLPYWRETLRA